MKKITMIIILGLLLISSAVALVSTEYGQGVVRGENVLYKGEVNKRINEVTEYQSINLTLQQFVNKNLETHDFNLKHTDEIIFDVKQSKLYYVYTFITAQPNLENGELKNIKTVKFEYYEPVSYTKFQECRETKTTLECKDLGEQITTKKVENTVEKFRTHLINLQSSIEKELNPNGDNVYNDFVNNLS